MTYLIVKFAAAITASTAAMLAAYGGMTLLLKALHVSE
jgi:hypothetical protein